MMRLCLLTASVMAITAAGAGVRAGRSTIDQSGQRFSESSAAVVPGDTVVFANHDDVTHNISVTGGDSESADLGLQKPGQSLTHLFDKSGRFKIRCSIHPSMKMTINVD